jgi:hypothetical protein
VSVRSKAEGIAEAGRRFGRNPEAAERTRRRASTYPLFVSADQQGPGEKGSSGLCARSIRLNRNRNRFDRRIDRSYDWHWNDAGA